MDFSITFFKLFFWGIYLAFPILFVVSLIIISIGLIVGRIESWSKFDAVYWAFITALTVGYGDLRPVRKSSKIFSIIIAWCGITLTGLLVAIAVKTASTAFQMHIDPSILQSIEQSIN